VARNRKKPVDRFKWSFKHHSIQYGQKKLGETPSGSFEWFAIDRDGYVGAFDGRENGYVPKAVFSVPKDQQLFLFEHFARPIDESLGGDSVTGYPKQGIFYYEIEDLSLDGYDRLGQPQVPLHVTQCAPEIRSILAVVRFDGLFAESPRIFVEKHWEVVNPYRSTDILRVAIAGIRQAGTLTLQLLQKIWRPK
jgi:hypothetical protein